MQEPLKGISFNFALLFIHRCNFFVVIYMMMQKLAVSFNEVPASDAVFVFSNCYNRFWVI